MQLAVKGFRQYTNDELMPVGIEDFVSEGMSQNKAKILLFLVKNRVLFEKATAHGDGELWTKTSSEISRWKRSDYVDAYYTLAHWVFDENELITQDLINTTKNLVEMTAKHLPESIHYQEFPYSRLYSATYNFREETKELEADIASFPTIKTIKTHFQDNKQIIRVLDRLQAGVQSHNPYWINSKKKLYLIADCLLQCMKNNSDINAVLLDKNSELSRAINTNRLLFFKDKTKSQIIMENVNTNKPKP